MTGGSAMVEAGLAVEVQETFTSKGIVADTQRGLTDDPKWLSSLYFYDRRGSELFEKITHTPEYYPTRTEEAILEAHAPLMLAAAGDDLLLGELGSGSSRKTRVVLAALLRRQEEAVYVPVDVSAEFLADVATDLEAAYPGLQVHPVAAEYKEGLRQIGQHPATQRLVLFLGSSIGNFEPPEQVGLLRAAHDALEPGDCMLIGTDLVKDPEVLEAAYNDAEGVTAAFNLNILSHLARKLDADIDTSRFAHRAFWNADASRIEMHLVSLDAQTLRLPRADLEVELQASETIHTENSYKFTIPGVESIVSEAGFHLEQTWTDDKEWFALHLLRRD